MQDRFRELEAEGSDSEPEIKDVESGEPDKTNTVELSPMEDEAMKEFFEDVNTIKTGMSLIRRNIKAIEESYGQTLVAINVEQGNKSGEDLEKLIDATNFATSDVRNHLKMMGENIKKDQGPQGTAQDRIRRNMHGGLTKKFIELMNEYQDVQTKYKNKYKERVERQYKIVKPDATPEEIEEVLQSGNSSQIFAQEILDNQRRVQAKDALAYIENKHKDILKLEQSIQELHQLFLEMAILVEAQGELIDQIEYNVSKSVAYSGEALKQLRKANKLQKSSRKKMCCIVIILVLVLAALAGGVSALIAVFK